MILWETEEGSFVAWCTAGTSNISSNIRTYVHIIVCSVHAIQVTELLIPLVISYLQRALNGLAAKSRDLHTSVLGSIPPPAQFLLFFSIGTMQTSQL